MNERLVALLEVRRELRVRHGIYPRLVAAGKLSTEEAMRRTNALTLAELIIVASKDDVITHFDTTGGTE